MATNPLVFPCPHCGVPVSLEQAWNDLDGRRFFELFVQLPPVLHRPYYNYLTLFKPARQTLRWTKLLTLTQELLPLIKAAQIKRNGTTYCIPTPHWESALQGLVDNPPATLQRPLKNNAYLLTILANQAEQGLAKAEAKATAQTQSGQRPAHPAPEMTYNDLVARAAEKERERRAKHERPPKDAVVDTETGELVPKPKSRPPNNWNPLKNYLPTLPEQPAAQPPIEIGQDHE